MKVKAFSYGFGNNVKCINHKRVIIKSIKNIIFSRVKTTQPPLLLSLLYPKSGLCETGIIHTEIGGNKELLVTSLHPGLSGSS